ncbi:unnamed protein product [Wickerhamomyces anomalus]
MSVFVPPGVKYRDILEDKHQLIDVQMLVNLFNSVAPKLQSILQNSNEEYIVAWGKLKNEISSQDSAIESESLILGIDMVYNNRYQGFLKNIDSFKDVSEKLAKRIDSHIQTNEKELLQLIMQSKSLVPSILDLFKDVDKLEEDIIHMFDELSDFLNEISSHYKALSNLRAKCTN